MSFLCTVWQLTKVGFDSFGNLEVDETTWYPFLIEVDGVYEKSE
jgi:hypothetical protein